MKVSEIQNLPEVLSYLQYKPKRNKVISANKPLFESKVKPIPPEIEAIIATLKKHPRMPRVKRQKGTWPPPNALF